MRKSYKIGGEGETGQIDQTLITRRKNYRGRIVHGRWLFRGVNLAFKRCCLEIFPNRSQGTLVVSEESWAYANTGSVTGGNYARETVNH